MRWMDGSVRPCEGAVKRAISKSAKVRFSRKAAKRFRGLSRWRIGADGCRLNSKMMVYTGSEWFGPYHRRDEDGILHWD